MTARSVIEHALTVYFADSRDPQGVVAKLLDQYDDERNHPVTELRIPADHVHTEEGPIVEVRTIERGEKGLLTVNPGDDDQLDGNAWEHATVTRT